MDDEKRVVDDASIPPKQQWLVKTVIVYERDTDFVGTRQELDEAISGGRLPMHHCTTMYDPEVILVQEIDDDGKVKT